jgi:hypothetical protein
LAKILAFFASTNVSLSKNFLVSVCFQR